MPVSEDDQKLAELMGNLDEDSNKLNEGKDVKDPLAEEDSEDDKKDSKKDGASEEDEPNDEKASEEESESTSDDDKKDDEEKPLSVDDVKDLILKGESVPDGTDSTTIRCAKAEIESEEAALESAAYRKRIQDNPTELLNAEQKEELSTLFTAGDQAAYEAKKKEFIDAAKEGLESDPKLEEYRKAAFIAKRVERVKQFCKDNGMTITDFEQNVGRVDYERLTVTKDLSFEDYLVRVRDNWAAKTKKKIYKGETPPKVVKGGRGGAGPIAKSEAQLMEDIIGGGKK